MLIPDWLPPDVTAYLETETSDGSMRSVARTRGAQPSTVMRQVRRVAELRRSDPAVEYVLQRLLSGGGFPVASKFWINARKVLPPMLKSNARLVWSPGMADAILAHSVGDEIETLGTVQAEVCGILALVGLTRVQSGEVGLRRYRITSFGRKWLMQGGADHEPELHQVGPQGSAGIPLRAAQSITPLEALLRRKVDGEQWLSPDLAKVARSIGRDWFAAGQTIDGIDAPYCGQAAHEARLRLRLAFLDIGEGAMLEVLKAYCITEQNIETVERRLSLPSRSGKVLFREALVRVKRIYEAQNALKSGQPNGSAFCAIPEVPVPTLPSHSCRVQHWPNFG
ncbi:DUF6456 domain-containing protein [Pelagimonas varians]|uniref:DUF6456 domain-containing protein n=1 Tax=Pelagimonas varians TaxID=696760 RepID=A0A238K105_9RHOB|nr:DUF6456 domain-containing protein [Pelagimonas varians]PYG33138.1 hypothetical protein C8N36_102133 [Pelagimonas varians]SMX35792.1 hypothetical protein PEV8663_00595 [Pelagimonas varians]